MTPDYDIALTVNQLSLWYGERQALNNIDLQIPKHRITALIGLSGCGKSTLLRCFNRMNDVIDGCRMEGEILLDRHAVMQAELGSAGASAWCSSGPIRFPSRSMRMRFTVCVCRACAIAAC